MTASAEELLDRVSAALDWSYGDYDELKGLLAELRAALLLDNCQCLCHWLVEPDAEVSSGASTLDG